MYAPLRLAEGGSQGALSRPVLVQPPSHRCGSRKLRITDDWRRLYRVSLYLGRSYAQTTQTIDGGIASSSHGATWLERTASLRTLRVGSLRCMKDVDDDSSTMKIALIVPSFSPDDTAHVSTPLVRVLVEALSAHVEMHVVPLRYPPQSVAYRYGPATVHPIGGEGLRLRDIVRRGVGALRDEHRREHFDVLHALWLHEPGSVALATRALLRVPVLASIGGAEVANIPVIGYGGALARWGRYVTRWVLTRADGVTGGSR